MKSTLKTLATLVVAATFAFAGCEKDNITPIVPDTPDEETPVNIYAGTSWTAHLENTYYYEGFLRMDIDYRLSLDFLDSVRGELFHDINIDVPDYPAASQNQNMTEEFTYTFGKDSVVLYLTYVDDETGDTIDYNYVLPYDKEANTLTLVYNDPDMAEICGTDTVVFTQVETPAKSVRPRTTTGKTNWRKFIGKVAQALEN